MTTYEFLSLLITACSAIFVGVSIFILSRQLEVVIKMHSDNHDWNRRIETQNAITKIRQMDTDALNEKFGHINRLEPIPLEEVKDAFEENPSLQGLLHKILNFYEGLANGVFLGTYDENVVKANRQSVMRGEFVRFRDYIEYRRHSGNRLTAWTSYERLVNKWSEESAKQNDLPPTGKIN